MLRKSFFLLTIGLIVSGCGAKLRPDRFPPAAFSGYPSAEFYACGERWLGLGYCEIEKGRSVEEIEFAIQGFYKGRIRIFSEALPADVIFSYEGSKRIPIDLRGTPNAPIVLGIAVNPEYPGENENAVELFGTIGWLLINVTEPGEVFTFHRTLRPVSTDQLIRVDSSGASSHFVVSDECGVEREILASGAETEIRLSGLGVSTQMIGSCILFIASNVPSFDVWLSWRYAQDFRPLAIPSIKVEKRKLHVDAESGVTIVALDSKVEVDHKGKFDWDGSKSHVLRLLTVKGRTLVGEYEPGKGWSWKS